MSLISCRLSMEHLRSEGYLVWKTEFWNPHAHKRVDMWGFADILAIRPRTDCRGESRLLVQSCTDDLAAHERKLQAEPRVLVALRSGFHVQIHSWRKFKHQRGRVLNVTSLIDDGRS